MVPGLCSTVHGSKNFYTLATFSDQMELPISVELTRTGLEGDWTEIQTCSHKPEKLTPNR